MVICSGGRCRAYQIDLVRHTIYKLYPHTSHVAILTVPFAVKRVIIWVLTITYNYITNETYLHFLWSPVGLQPSRDPFRLHPPPGVVIGSAVLIPIGALQQNNDNCDERNAAN